VASAVAERYRAEERPVTVAAGAATEAGTAATANGGPPAAVRMAPETLEAVLVNLVDNSLHHGGPAVKVEIAVFPTPAPAGREPAPGRSAAASAVTVEVRDDGAGISAANAARIFDPFFTTARDRGGTGLGLTIVRTLVRAHDGDVTLEPSERGARFRVRLPAAG
jgi:signal transduction histidine kinase